MSDLVDEFFSTPIPKEVWHYTNLAGFEGILSSGTVWATEAHHTTDPTEFVHARAVAAAFLEKVKPDDKSMARAKQAGLETLAHAFDGGALSEGQMEVFVASFSSAANLKSQWMGYGDGGRGVSIAFDLRGIRPPREIGSAVTFAPCLYVQEEKERLLEIALGRFIETVAKLHRNTTSQQWVAKRLQDWSLVDHIYGLNFDRGAFEAANQEHFGEQLHTALTHTSFDLLRLASHCKDYGFHQEGEWRLSLPHTKTKPFINDEVHYRGAQKDIPYVANNLFRERLPITQVLIGPLSHEGGRIHEVLEKYGYHVPVVKSGVPT